MSKYVLAIGELLIDAVTNNTVYHLAEANLLQLHAGGSPANFCRYLQRCGTQTKLIASIGNDGLGEIVFNCMINAGIDTTCIKKIDHKNTSLIIVAKTPATPDFIAYRNSDAEIDIVDVSLIKNSALVHSTAFALSKEPAQSNIVQAFKDAHALNIPISVDWNYAAQIWGTNNNAVNIFKIIQQYKPYLKFSIDDVSRFLNKSISIEEAKSYLSHIAATATCLTCGSQGVYYKQYEQSTWQFCEAPVIQVTNATGAGDSFWAGFIHAIITQKSIEEAVQYGIYVASIKLQGKWSELE